MTVQQVSAYVQESHPVQQCFSEQAFFEQQLCLQTSHSRIFLLEICWWH